MNLRKICQQRRFLNLIEAMAVFAILASKTGMSQVTESKKEYIGDLFDEGIVQINNNGIEVGEFIESDLDYRQVKATAVCKYFIVFANLGDGLVWDYMEC